MKTSFAVFVLASALAAAQTEPPAPPAPPAPPVPPRIAIRSGSYLGIGVAEVDAERARELKLSEERGVYITKVEPGSPADKAGLKQGDVVLEYQGQRVEGTEQFMRIVRETPPGRQVKLTINRNGATQTVTATAGSRKDRPWPLGPEFHREMERLQERFRMPDMPQPFMSWRSSMLGVEAESLTPQLAEFFGVKEGVLVRSVLKDSAAEKAGIKAGDVITEVDGKAVKTPGDISREIRSLGSTQTVPVTVVRERRPMTLPVTIERAPDGRGDSPRPRPVVRTGR